MTAAQAGPGVVGMDTQKVIASTAVELRDSIAVEEPLEIRLTADVAGRRGTREVAVTMRTPGDDRDLAAGFLFTEGIVSESGEIDEICVERSNVIAARVSCKPATSVIAIPSRRK